MTGHYCFTIYDTLEEVTIFEEFFTLHDTLVRLRELEIDYNAPGRFKYCRTYSYNVED